MRIFAQNEPLTDAEFDRLGEFLKGCTGGKAMNVEELDGFFAALVAGPDVVMPSEYLPEVFGGEMSEAHEFGSLEEANEIISLLMRHWNDIAATLSKDEVYLPILLEDENGVPHANDWARGFMRGVEMRPGGWAELIRDEEHGGCMFPVLMLYHEHDPDPEMRPKPIGAEQREKVIEYMGQYSSEMSGGSPLVIIQLPNALVATIMATVRTRPPIRPHSHLNRHAKHARGTVP